LKTKYSNIFVNPDFYDVMYRTPIAFDLDSVMNNLGHDMGRYIANEFGVTDVRATNLGYQKFHFEVDGVGYEEVSKVVNKYVMEESPSALPSPYLHEVMKYVYEVTDVPIAVVTARYPDTCTVTKNWLDENLDKIPYRVYIMHGEQKNMVLGLLDAKIFVDDRHKTIRNLIGEIKYPVLYRKPWNQGRPDKLPVIEIRDLRDIIPLLNIQLGRMPMEWPNEIFYPNREREETHVSKSKRLLQQAVAR
jgi:5'(3')-deoxyribonucleotidase